MPSRYAGRNEIAYSTAAGERTEADGGETRNAGWSEIYTFRIGSIRNNEDASRETSGS